MVQLELLNKATIELGDNDDKFTVHPEHIELTLKQLTQLLVYMLSKYPLLHTQEPFVIVLLSKLEHEAQDVELLAAVQEKHA